MSRGISDEKQKKYRAGNICLELSNTAMENQFQELRRTLNNSLNRMVLFHRAGEKDSIATLQLYIA